MALMSVETIPCTMAVWLAIRPVAFVILHTRTVGDMS